MSDVGESREFVGWIQLAMRHVLEASTSQRIVGPRAAGSSKPLERRPRCFEREGPFPMHRHLYPEVCVSLEGESALEMAKLYCRMRPPQATFVAGGMLHCERRWKRDCAYRLMWIIPGMTGNCGLHVSHYNGRGKWSAPRCLYFPSPAVARLLAHFTPSQAQAIQWDVAWADVLVILAEGLGHAARQVMTGQVTPQADPSNRLIEQAKAYLETNLHHKVSVAGLAKMMGLNEDHLNRLFRRATGLSMYAFLTRKRMDSAMDLCQKGNMPIKQIALGLGYDDPLYFSRAFRAFHGLSPSEAQGP